VGAIALGWPVWEMEVTLANGFADEVDAWQAFLDTLEGPRRPFLARDLTRPWPAAYPNGFAGLTRAGGGAFDGTADWQVSCDGRTLTLSRLPAAMQFRVRDYVGWRWSAQGTARRALARTTAPAVASAGGVVSLTIAPPLPAFVPRRATVTLDQPDCVMRLVPGSRLGPRDTLHSAGGRITAIEDLRG
jgi:hypothetical protein